MDDSAWIHRDKLAQIESKEMQEAGLSVRKSNSKNLRLSNKSGSRSGSRASNRQTRDSTETRNASVSHSAHPLPIDTNGLIETSGFGFEDAEDGSSPADLQHSNSRPHTSRIPINKNSPVPLSSSYTERDSPVTRSRNGSLAFGSSPPLIVNKSGTDSRPRSQSLGSQQMLEEAGITPNSTQRTRPVSVHLPNSLLLNESSDSAVISSPKLHNPKNASKKARKSGDSLSGSISKARVVSNGSTRDSHNSARPKSRGRPHSVHRPEGEAPWIATMYKPDPMLPPDQQLLPTHAKKLMQEQWEREGKTGDAYDRNFNLLNSNEIANRGGVAASSGRESMEIGPESGTTTAPRTTSGPHKPLTDPPTQSPVPAPFATSSFTPGSRQGSVSGGYRITPTIDQSNSPVLWRQSTLSADQNRTNSVSGPGDFAGAAPSGPGGKRQSVYRLQTVGNLPREQEVRDAAAGPATQKPLPSTGPAEGVSRDQQQGPVVHRLDPEKLGRRSIAEEAGSSKGCGLKCVVM